MSIPCEDAIWNILPMIRADLARELKKMGLRQKAIADTLSLTPSAVSQYIHNKRGETGQKSPAYSKMIADGAKKITMCNSDDIVRDVLCKCCKDIRCDRKK